MGPERALDRNAVDLLRARSSPSGCAARSPASAAASTSGPAPGARAASQMARIRACASSSVCRHVAVDLVDVAARDLENLVSMGIQQLPHVVADRCGRAPSGWRSCTSSGAGSEARRRRGAGSGSACPSTILPADRSRPRRHRRRRRPADRDGPWPPRRRGSARSRVRRPHGSTRGRHAHMARNAVRVWRTGGPAPARPPRPR